MRRKKEAKNVERERDNGTEQYALMGRRLERARKLRRSKRAYYTEAKMQRALNLWRGKHWGEDTDDPSKSSSNPSTKITVNLIRATVKDFVAFLVNKRPVFGGKPRSRAAIGAVRRKLAQLNYFWTEQKMQKQFRRSALDGAILGRGIIKTGYVLEVDTAKNAAVDGKINYDDFLREDHPFIRRVNPFFFYIDPNARDHDLATARWVAEDFFVSRGDLLANSKYKASLLEKVRSGAVKPMTAAEYASDRELDAVTRAVLEDDIEAVDDPILCTEVWDKKYMKFYIFLHGIEEEGPLLEEDWPYDYLDGFPYVFYSFEEEPDEESGHGLPILCEDQQLELNRVRTQQYNQRRRFATRKYAVQEGGVDETEKAKLTNGTDGELITTKHPNALSLIDQGTPPADNQLVEATIKDDFQKLAGSDQLLQGGMLPSRTSATEVRARQSIIGLKVEAAMEHVDVFLNEIAVQVTQHVEANFTKGRTLRALDENGDEVFEKASHEDIRAEFDLEISSSTKEREDPQMERQQAMTIAQSIMGALPALQAVGSQVNPDAVLRWALGKFKDVELNALFGAPLPPPLTSGGGTSLPSQPAPVAGPPDMTSMAAVDPASMAMAGAMGGLSAGAR